VARLQGRGQVLAHQWVGVEGRAWPTRGRVGGMRPGRGPHDAAYRLAQIARRRRIQWVVEGR